VQPHGIGLHDNVIKESQEEAGIPEALACQAIAAGAVSYMSGGSSGFGMKRDVLFVFDLELPESFVPQPMDGEVESFELMPVERVLEVVAETDEYKDNCNLVLIDFFIRHGRIAADSPGYLTLLTSIRQGDCS
jgi:NUDIX domain